MCESAHKGVDMEGLLRLPWNIEVKVTKYDPSANPNSGNSLVGTGTVPVGKGTDTHRTNTAQNDNTTPRGGGGGTYIYINII